MAQAPRCSEFAVNPYPGEVVAYPSIIVDGRVVALGLHAGRLQQHSGRLLSDLFDELSINPHNLVPLLTYGSNACPGRLLEKFGLGALGVRRLDGICLVPIEMSGATPAWSCQPSRRGALPFTLADHRDGRVPAHLMLVPPGLVGDLDRSEGRSGAFYVVARLKDVTVELPNGSQWMRPLAYVGVGLRGPLVFEGRVLTPAESSESVARSAIASGSGCDGAAWLPRMSELPSGMGLPEAVEPEGCDQVVFDLTGVPPP